MSLLRPNISVSFGGVKAVRELSFAVEAGEVFSIVGPNGAGKTTMFNLISRIYDMRTTVPSPSTAGTSALCRPMHIAELGIARTFQNTELFEHGRRCSRTC